LVTSYLKIGQALFSLGRVEETLNNYDATIQIKGSDIAAVYLSRAVAEIEINDAAAAVKDAVMALKLNPKASHYVLWLHLVRMHVGQHDAHEFTTNAKQIDRGKWPGPVVALFIGLMNIEELRSVASSAEQPNTRIGQSCEADNDGSAWSADGDCTGRVVRSGGWINSPEDLRSASRSGAAAGLRIPDLGFRLGRTLSARAGEITVAPSEH
jgi:hypothetical protein